MILLLLRDVTWSIVPAETPFIWQSATITRGYTFHEQLDSVALVHMNGRVYDPEIGRFLSADPFIQDITNSQALNAYAYVNNNPLSYTDPSGFFLSGLFKSIGNFFRSIGRAFASAAKAIVKSGIGRAILQIIACANPAAAITCPAAAAGLTLAAGGSLKEALFAAAISFGQMGVSNGGVIDVWGIVGDAVQASGTGVVGTALSHGVISGAISVAQAGRSRAGLSPARSRAVWEISPAGSVKFASSPRPSSQAVRPACSPAANSPMVRSQRRLR